ncbi:MAG TPA: ABC transporter permease [Caldilineae bacterium]|nr:ABC transporter permease [Caldilineae bacterium]
MTVDVRKRWWGRGDPRAVMQPLLQRWVMGNVEVLLVPVVLFAILALWEMVVRVAGYPSFILPSPGRVWSKFLVVLADGTLWRHTRVTLMEIAGGLGLGVSLALVIGYGLAKSPLLERLLSPYIVASQSVPVVAIAPLLLIWFGFGVLSKVLVCALTVFFPMLVNTIIGIRSVEPELVSLMRSLRATRWQTFVLLEVPAALPILFGGLKVAVTLAVIGAVVGEFVGADRGLGFLLNLSRGILDTPLLFVALFTLIFIALALYLTVSWLELWLLRWQRVE